MTEQATPITVIELWPLESECCCCGESLLIYGHGPSYGVPVYEGEVLRNDHAGEWGGMPACKRCFDWCEANQDRLPMCMGEAGWLAKLTAHPNAYQCGDCGEWVFEPKPGQHSMCEGCWVLAALEARHD